MRKTWVMAFFVILLAASMVLNTRFKTVVLPLSFLSWTVWGVDDIATHYLFDSTISWIYSLKCFLFDLHKELQSQAYIEPTKPPTLMTSDYSYERISASSNEPTVFRGLFSNSAATNKWKDVAYLNKTIGDVTCPFVLTNANHFEINRVSMLYSEIFDILTNDPTSSLYVSGDQFIFMSPLGSQMLNDLEFEKYLGTKFMNSDLYSQKELYLFVGNRGKSGTSWHCAPHQSLFVQVSGRKRWTFIHPKYSILLRPQRSHLYSRLFLASDNFRVFHNQAEKNSGCTNCSVKFDGELFGNVPRTQVILEPGDVVTVPSWYWHHVENLPNDPNTEEGNIIIGVDVDTKVWNNAWLWALFPLF